MLKHVHESIEKHFLRVVLLESDRLPQWQAFGLQKTPNVSFLFLLTVSLYWSTT